MTTNRLKLLAALIAAVAMASTTYAFDYDLSWHTIDCGGGTVSGGAYELSGTLGQHDAGTMTGGTFELAGGFWGAGLPSGPPAPGDCDADGDVDLADYSDLAGCLDGPGVGLGGGCDCFDLDADADVDLLDFAELQVNFTGN